MRRTRLWSTVPALLLIVAGLASAQGAGPFWAVRGVTLIDGTGASPLRNAVVTGRGDRITCAGGADLCIVPKDARVLDATGKWIVPGLINTHVHLVFGDSGETRRSQLLRFAFGTTTTRDAGGTAPQFEETVSRRHEAELSESPEPRLVVSGLVSNEGMQHYRLSNFADLVRKFSKAGADAIKIKQKFSPEELQAIISAAHAANLPVWGHTNESGLQAALDADIDGLPHLFTFSTFALRTDVSREPMPSGIDAWVWRSEAWNHLDESRLKAVTDAIISKGVWIEPQLVVEKHFTVPYPIPPEQAYLEGVPSFREILRPWLPIGEQSFAARNRRSQRLVAVYERQCQFVKDFHALGGIVITGTDESEAALSLLEEVKLLAGCGFSSMDALEAATKQAAIAIRRPDLGTLETGKLADLLVLNGDPLADTSNLKRIWRVMKGGRLYDPAELLRPILEEHRKQVRNARLTRGTTGVLLFLVAIGGVITVRRVFRRERATRVS